MGCLETRSTPPFSAIRLAASSRGSDQDSDGPSRSRPANDLPFSSERQGRVRAYHGCEELRASARGVAAPARLRPDRCGVRLLQRPYGGSRLLREPPSQGCVPQRHHPRPRLQMDPHPLSLLGRPYALQRIPLPRRSPETSVSAAQVHRPGTFIIRLRSASGRGLDSVPRAIEFTCPRTPRPLAVGTVNRTTSFAASPILRHQG